MNDWVALSLSQAGLNWCVNYHQLIHGAALAEAMIKQGINLIGHAYADIGLGEDLRMVARSLLASNIPFEVVNITLENDLRYSNSFLNNYEISFDQAHYKTSLFCMTPDRMEACLVGKNDSFFKDNYLIAAWPWEFTHWPTEMVHYFSMVNELWANSKHIERSLSASKYHVKPPIYLMPAATEVPLQSMFESKKAARSFFGIAEGAFVMICQFDVLSNFHRKNPQGAVAAFRKAFDAPQYSNRDVCLILKTHNITSFCGPWEHLKLAVANDSRFMIIEKTYTNDQVIELLRCCDGLLSLHRAEGYGRVISESMILGLGVIATNYSGNTDYMQGDNVYPVTYELKAADKLAKLINPENQFWAEPDIDNAAFLIRQFYQKYCEEIRQNTFPSINVEIQEVLSVGLAGKRYAQRLNQLWGKD